MQGKLIQLVLLPVLIGSGVGVEGQSLDSGKGDETPVHATKPAITSPVTVPEGNGAPVITVVTTSLL